MAASGYAVPRSIDEAVALLAGTPGARVLAGGQRLLVEPNRSRLAGALLVDLRRIPGLTGIERQPDGSLKIGAMTTAAAMASSEVLRGSCPALAEAAHVAGDAQMRNRATLGGLLADPDPEGHLPAPVLVLDATVHLVGSRGPRTLPAADLLTGPRQTALRSDEVITAVTIPAPAERSGTAYEQVRHPATMQAVCGVAAQVALAENGTVKAARVAVTGAVERAARLPEVEKALVGKRLADETVSAAARTLAAGPTFRADLFGSGEYRRHLTRVLTERALKRASARAGA